MPDDVALPRAQPSAPLPLSGLLRGAEAMDERYHFGFARLNGLAEFARSGVFSYATPLIEMIYISGGEALLWTGNEALHLKGHQFLVVSSGVERNWQVLQPLQGYYSCVNQDLINLGQPEGPIMMGLNGRFKAYPVAAMRQPMHDLGELMVRLYQGPRHPFWLHNLQLIKAEASYWFMRELDHSLNIPPAHRELISRFLQTVWGSGFQRATLKVMSRHLGVSSRQLNDVLRTHLSATAQEIHHERLAYLAQSLVRDTREPVKAIARRLGFADTASFVRYFKNLTGKTPSEFRDA